MVSPLEATLSPKQRARSEAFRESEQAQKAAAEAWAAFDTARREAIDGGKNDPATLKRIQDLSDAYDKAADASRKADRATVGDEGFYIPADTRTGLGDTWFKAVAEAPHSPLTSKAFTTGTFNVPPAFDSQVVELGRRRRFVQELLPTRQLEGTDQFMFFRQTVRTNAAAPVASGGTKPTSTITLERVDGRLRVIAHVSEPVDRFLLQDADTLRDFLESEMRLGVLLTTDTQLLTGSGSGENIRGILNTVGILSQPLGADSRTDAIAKAITALVKVENIPNAVVLNPDDAEQIFLEKDSNGQYIYGPPTEPFTGGRIWGLEVITSNAMTAGTGLVGDFNAARFYIAEEGTQVQFSEEHASQFVTNQVISRGEARVGLAVLRPAAFCEVTGI